MPKDNEVEENVMPFAWAMTDYQADGPNTQFTRDPHAAQYHAGNGIDVEPLYSAATVAELRAKADAAERRVGELEAALRNLVAINEAHNKACEEVMGRPLGWKDDYLNDARKALTGADPT